MCFRPQLIITGAILLGLASATSNAASVKVYRIVGQVDSNWTVDDTTYYHGTSPGPLIDSFGYPTVAWLSGTWTSSPSSTVTAPGTSGLDIGASQATGTGSYTASISNSAFSFSGSGYAQTLLDNSSLTAIAAEGAASLYLYFQVPAGDLVYMHTQGTIGFDGYSTAQYRVTQVFPGDINVNMFLVQSDTTQSDITWDTSILLNPGTYRVDYFASSTYYPAFPDTAGASRVYSDTSYPESFSALGTINVETTFETAFVPEPAIVGTLVSGASVLVLRRRRTIGIRAGRRVA